MEKAHILGEIRRTAEDNDGKPLGRMRFAAATGIKEHDWLGRYWARWSDAVGEAGFPPNQLQARFDDTLILDALISEVRARGRLPTYAELQMRRTQEPEFPNAKVFERLGPKASWASTVAARCQERTDCADVLAIVEPLIQEAASAAHDEETDGETVGEFGSVYLLKSGGHYKVGRSNSVGRRNYELAIQLPERAELVHEIRTDDPVGIERYWHSRFAERRKNGEWFELTRADVSAFKRRRFQ